MEPVTTLESHTGHPYDLVHFPPTSASTSTKDPALVLVLIPGNPGLASYYTPFLTALLAHLPPSSSAYAVGHLSHSPAPSSPTKGPPPTLSDQVQHKLAVLDALDQKHNFGIDEGKTHCVLLGHSVGSWISLQVLSARPALVASHHALFPTISHIQATPNGRVLTPLFSPLLTVPIHVSTSLLSLLPAPLLSPLVSLLSRQTDPSSLKTTTALLQSPRTVRAALAMAHDEMATILSPPMPVLEEHKDRLRFYFASEGNDGWVSELSVDEVTALYPPGANTDRVVRDGEGMKHAFVLEKGATESLAKTCAEWLKSDFLMGNQEA